MSNSLHNYQTAEGLNDEEMSALLSDRLGRVISPTGYKMVKGRKDTPPQWLEALGLAPQDGPTVFDPPQEPRTIPEFAKETPLAVLPFDVNSAHMQITMMYTLGGKGAARFLKAPAVEGAWGRYAPQIASAYIEWAKEDATVANIIRVVTLGGPAGTVVLLHGSLLIETLILSGKLNTDALLPPSVMNGEFGDVGETDFDTEPEPETNDEPVRTSRNGPQPKTTRTRTPRASA